MPEQGVTVVIPTVDREKFAIDTITDLIAQEYRPLEILVVDQSETSSSALLTVIDSHRDVVSYHHVPFRGSAKARNYGWQHAQYNAIVFVDDDIRCGPALVSEHLRTLRLPGVGLVAGGFDSHGGEPDTGPPTGRFVLWTATPRPGFASDGEFDIDHVQECNFSVWREVMRRVGGIDEAFDVPAALYEGTDFSLRVKRAGFRVYFNGKARLLHLAAPGGGNRVFNTARYVYGLAHNRAILIRRHISWFHSPTALLRLAMLCFSYAAHYRVPGALFTGLKGFVRGWRAAANAPHCTTYDSAGSAVTTE
jgi:GT2 family glycosyltransferase